jgi:hypothetical protein
LRCKPVKDDSKFATPSFLDPHIPCPIDLPEKDRPVFMAAISIQANYFLTGDITHFGEHFGKSVSGVRICRPRDYSNMRQTKQER